MGDTNILREHLPVSYNITIPDDATGLRNSCDNAAGCCKDEASPPGGRVGSGLNEADSSTLGSGLVVIGEASPGSGSGGPVDTEVGRKTGQNIYQTCCLVITVLVGQPSDLS